MHHRCSTSSAELLPFGERSDESCMHSSSLPPFSSESSVDILLHVVLDSWEALGTEVRGVIMTWCDIARLDLEKLWWTATNCGDSDGSIHGVTQGCNPNNNDSNSGNKFNNNNSFFPFGGWYRPYRPSHPNGIQSTPSSSTFGCKSKIIISPSCPFFPPWLCVRLLSFYLFVVVVVVDWIVGFYLSLVDCVGEAYRRWIRRTLVVCVGTKTRDAAPHSLIVAFG